MSARPTSSRLPALGAILGFTLVRLVAGRRSTPARRVPGQLDPRPGDQDTKPSNSAPSSRDASREPGRGREATSPTEIPAKGWRDIFWRVYEEINKDRILAVAAGVTFYGLLGLFPALAALVSIYGLFADPATIQDHLNLLSGVLPGGALDVIGEQVKRITSKGSGTLGFTFFSGLAISLWSANAGVKAVFDALNVAYGEEEKRGFIALNLRSLAFTLGMIVFALVAIGAIVVVPVLLNFIGLGQGTEWIISLARWPVLLGAIVLVLVCSLPLRAEPRHRPMALDQCGQPRGGGGLGGRFHAVLLVRGELRHRRRGAAHFLGSALVTAPFAARNSRRYRLSGSSTAPHLHPSRTLRPRSVKA